MNAASEGVLADDQLLAYVSDPLVERAADGEFVGEGTQGRGLSAAPVPSLGALSDRSYCRKHTPEYANQNPKRISGGKAATFRRKTLAEDGRT